MDITVDTIEVFVGLDVGKADHHAVGLDRSGHQLLSRPLPTAEAAVRSLLQELQQHGTVLVVVDHPATIGALPVAVAPDAGIAVAYLPGLTMRRMADTLPGDAKTDARDAFVIATTARTAPHTLRALTGTEEQVAALKLACGADAILGAEHTATVNRLRGLLTPLHPALERVLGPQLGTACSRCSSSGRPRRRWQRRVPRRWPRSAPPMAVARRRDWPPRWPRPWPRRRSWSLAPRLPPASSRSWPPGCNYRSSTGPNWPPRSSSGSPPIRCSRS